MRWLIVSSVVALAPYAAGSQEQQKQGNQQKQEKQPQSGDRHLQEQTGAQHDETYGQYGEEPGTESRSDAKQASDPKRPKSKASQDERRAGAAKSHTLRGRVVEVSPSSLSLEDEDRRVHRLQVTEQTEVLRGGKRVAIADLREGEEVRASAGGRGDRRVAKRITVGEDASRQPASVVDKGREDERRIGGERSEADRDSKPGLSR
jgi:hypothetical protein